MALIDVIVVVVVRQQRVHLERIEQLETVDQMLAERRRQIAAGTTLDRSRYVR